MTPEFGPSRTAIVTGGAKRIGAAICRALAADGWHVLIHCHESREQADALAAEIGGSVVSADLAAADCGAQVLAAAAGLPSPALLLNNASRFVLDGLEDFTAGSWDRHFLPNLRGPALLTQAFAAAVPEGEGGLIVNLLDAKLNALNADFFSYTLSKIGLAGLTELSARALASRAIRVCGIAPSVTLMSGPQNRENFEQVHELNPLRRGVEVEDIVRALRFLIDSPRITGQVIAIDGGQRMLGLPRDVQFLGLPPESYLEVR